MKSARRSKTALTLVPQTEPPVGRATRASQPAAALEPVLARLVGWWAGPLVVLLDDPTAQPRLAKSVVRLGEAETRMAAERNQQALVIFARNEPETPIVVGLVQSPDVRGEVIIDGERLVLRGRREIELQCGKASVILKEDGTVVVKGA